MRLFILFVAFTLLFCCSGRVAFAQVDIATVRALSFGEAIVTDNDSVHEVIVAPGGAYTNDPEFIFLTTPLSGVYRLTGASPSQAIDSVVVTVDQQLLGGGQELVLDNFTYNFPPTVDGSGAATITVGARMRNNGNGMPYTGPIGHNAILTISVTLL